MVLFDQGTYDKLLSEAPKFKLITPSILSDRLRVSFNFSAFFPHYVHLLIFLLYCFTYVELLILIIIIPLF